MELGPRARRRAPRSQPSSSRRMLERVPGTSSSEHRGRGSRGRGRAGRETHRCHLVLIFSCSSFVIDVLGGKKISHWLEERRIKLGHISLRGKRKEKKKKAMNPSTAAMRRLASSSPSSSSSPSPAVVASSSSRRRSVAAARATRAAAPIASLSSSAASLSSSPFPRSSLAQVN